MCSVYFRLMSRIKIPNWLTLALWGCGGACLLGRTSTSSYICWRFRTFQVQRKYCWHLHMIYTFDSNVPDVQPPRSIKAIGIHPAAACKRFRLQAQTLFRRWADAPQSDAIKCPIIWQPAVHRWQTLVEVFMFKYLQETVQCMLMGLRWVQ